MTGHHYPDLHITIGDANAARSAAGRNNRVPGNENGRDDPVVAARGNKLFFAADTASGKKLEPAIFFDGRNSLRPQALPDLGFTAHHAVLS